VNGTIVLARTHNRCGDFIGDTVWIGDA
jgi:hypothetical protein